jgi:hypothetical protein
MHRALSALLAAACGVGMTGCADALGVAHPAYSPVATVSSAGCDPSFPCFSSIDDVPASFFPKIYMVSPVVYWDGATSVSSSYMQYFGNCVRQDFAITITGPAANSRAAEFADCAFWPDSRVHQTSGATLTAGGTCGHTANLASTHTAISKIFIEWRGFTSSEVVVSAGDGAQQPPCTCQTGEGPPTGGENVTSISAQGDVAASCTGGGGPGQGTTTVTCYTMIVDHYWYYPDTDTYEYRYSETSTWCEENSE